MRAVVFRLFALVLMALPAAAQENPAHQDIRDMRDAAIAAFLARDRDAFLDQLAEGVIFTAMNNEVVRGRAAASDYWDRMLSGSDSLVENLEVEFAVDDLATLYTEDRSAVAAGDMTTRLDRWELDLNENAPGDPRDTTTPAAMTKLMRKILFGDYLSLSARRQLKDWMIASTTGHTRLRAGLPAGWIVGDKTGTSGNGAVNDVAFALPQNGGPILISCFLNAPDASRKLADEAHAEIARRVVKAMGA